MERVEHKSFQNIQELEAYQANYDESRFWKKVKKISKKVGVKVLHPLLSLYYLMHDGKISLAEKAYIVGALGYFILPIDVLPDFIVGLGYTDDLAVLMLLVKHFKDNITPEIEMRADGALKKIFNSNDFDDIA